MLGIPHRSSQKHPDPLRPIRLRAGDRDEERLAKIADIRGPHQLSRPHLRGSKKIGWKDGIKALGVILKYWVIDDLYATPYGRGVLNNLTGTPQYLSWLAHTLRPHLGDAVLEVGAGSAT